MSSTRPIMVAGPMERNSKPFNKGSVETLGDGPVGCPPPRPCPHAMLAVPKQTAAIVNVVNQRRRKTGARILVALPKSDFGCPAIMYTLSQTTGGRIDTRRHSICRRFFGRTARNRERQR